MKTTNIILLTAFGLIVTAFAATMTIEIPTADVPRVSEAYGSIYSLGHNANVNEVQEITRRWIMESTKDYERRKNQAVYTPPPLEMQPTPVPSPTPSASPTPAGFAVVSGAAAPVPSPTLTPTPKPKKK